MWCYFHIFINVEGGDFYYFDSAISYNSLLYTHPPFLRLPILINKLPPFLRGVLILDIVWQLPDNIEVGS
jgi:hypothetical protein